MFQKLFSFQHYFSSFNSGWIRTLSFALLTLSSNYDIHGQSPSSRPVTLLDQQNGLLHYSNYFIFKDSRDLVWINSDMGIFSYDGKNILLHQPEDQDQVSYNSNSVHSNICEDYHGNLWFGTWRGIASYIRDQDTFRNFSLPNAILHNRFFVCGIDSLRQVWFTHSDGIYTLQIDNGVIKRQADFYDFL